MLQRSLQTNLDVATSLMARGHEITEGHTQLTEMIR